VSEAFLLDVESAANRLQPVREVLVVDLLHKENTIVKLMSSNEEKSSSVPDPNRFTFDLQYLLDPDPYLKCFKAKIDESSRFFQVVSPCTIAK
jgi:hypothetical protein